MSRLRRRLRPAIILAVAAHGYPRCPYCGERVLAEGSPCRQCIDAAREDPVFVAGSLPLSTETGPRDHGWFTAPIRLADGHRG